MSEEGTREMNKWNVSVDLQICLHGFFLMHLLYLRNADSTSCWEMCHKTYSSVLCKRACFVFCGKKKNVLSLLWKFSDEF